MQQQITVSTGVLGHPLRVQVPETGCCRGLGAATFSCFTQFGNFRLKLILLCFSHPLGLHSWPLLLSLTPSRGPSPLFRVLPLMQPA